MKVPFDFSIIMPTLNAERTLEKALQSVRIQQFPQDRIEILVIDGGSTDATLTLAGKYRAKVLENPMVQQEFAKHTGLLNAQGRYALFLDADEVLANPDSLQKKLTAFTENPEVKILFSSGYETPPGAPAINRYINTLADPFACFVFRATAGKESRHFAGQLKRKYPLRRETPTALLFALPTETDPPLADLAGGVCCDLAFIKKLTGTGFQSPEFIPSAFQRIAAESGGFGITLDDPVCHYSADTLRTFLKKIRWRVIVNLHYPTLPGTGFSNRESGLSRRRRILKYAFLPYALTLVLPTAEGLVMTFRNRNAVFLLHGPLTFWTGALIIYYGLLKIIGIRPRLRSYGREEQELPLNR